MDGRTGYSVEIIDGTNYYSFSSNKKRKRSTSKENNPSKKRTQGLNTRRLKNIDLYTNCYITYDEFKLLMSDGTENEGGRLRTARLYLDGHITFDDFRSMLQQ